jgi:hypothetical protein
LLFFEKWDVAAQAYPTRIARVGDLTLRAAECGCSGPGHVPVHNCTLHDTSSIMYLALTFT